MIDDLDFESAHKLGVKALAISKAKSVPVTPRNYEVLFNYVAGTNKPLVTAVDTVIDRQDGLNNTNARRIYDEYLSPTRQADRVEEISSELSGQIEEAMSFISAAAGTTGAYGDSLEGVASRISETDSATDLKAMVETLALASREMERHSRAMESKLNESQRQINSLNARLDELRTESRTDALTGIANRKSFDETMAAEIAVAMETQEEICLLIGDVDRFKRFNDTYGHQTGDQVLRLVANAISSHVKGRDLAARYGGEEFAVILPQTNLRAAVTVANQIRERVQAKELVKKSTGESLGTITISLGVARYRHGEAIEEMIHRADACLYAAKNGGRNLVKCEADRDIDYSNVA